ncbi:tRNA pseudouridine(38-40) synthase TruA [Candidatus Erwinia haradaeae]|uniref:tRNA pseudouridine synthase A n=1 Tax=Candidatus Erwinia haradaeae TaxID=1922217 RepID=A0A451DAZ1_9GAMM|nr:tRNA pseudouridine(38-40) synthase TruA [Candidatus Erwinia haradaeae]VFP83396.1 tRNA pseudouridine synthase A [Candidatus Erwinia haradaeae]
MLKFTTKLALGVEYDGTRYCGWQKQRKVHSVQEKLEQALAEVADHPVSVMCAGRTDAGVHATGQVVHFETSSRRKDIAWVRGVNAYLPEDIVVRWMQVVPDAFHARFSALARRYRYVIYNQPKHRPAIFSKGMMYCSTILDVEKMQRAGAYLVGENDFTSFRASQCQSHSPIRQVMHIRVTRYYCVYIIIDIKANAFVYRMVRNIVGSLIEVGYGHKNESWIRDVLLAKDRKVAAAIASAQGLYLVSVDYPVHYAIPRVPVGPLHFIT